VGRLKARREKLILNFWKRLRDREEDELCRIAVRRGRWKDKVEKLLEIYGMDGWDARWWSQGIWEEVVRKTLERGGEEMERGGGHETKVENL